MLAKRFLPLLLLVCAAASLMGCPATTTQSGQGSPDKAIQSK
jgi:hypothetical protein